MTYRIEAIELYVRETPPGRMVFSLGRKGGTGDIDEGLRNPIGHVRLVVRDSRGNTTFGCAGDRLSVRWLDKRPERSHSRKRRELVDLIYSAADVYRREPEFESPFRKWLDCHGEIMKLGGKQNQEPLTSSFASALMERAIIDAVCRLEGKPVYTMLGDDRLGFDARLVDKSLAGIGLPQILPSFPTTEIFIRHTVGLSDPLTSADLPDDRRINDGLPETLEEYIAEDGIRYFKVKITGDADRDLERLARVWAVVERSHQPAITLDANEAYRDLDAFAKFVERFEREMLGTFQHIAYIEQPLVRSLTLDRATSAAIHKIAERKPLIIDESDGTLDAYKRAHALGYQGTSHKNCKGFFKSLVNYSRVVQHVMEGERAFISCEDLQNLPVVPLQQDFVAVGILGAKHCERNGHHYNYGLSYLSEKDKAAAVRSHTDLYVKRGDEWFLRIEDGRVRCESLQCPGFGVQDEPDWSSMQDMRDWVNRRHPA